MRSLRERKHLSQEQLAEISGLSLRTVQRAEAGHRVSYASLRSLAATFEMDVDLLERELYAMARPTEEFVESPGWLRVMNGKGWFKSAMTRRDTHVFEAVFLGIALLLFAWSFFVPAPTARVLRYGAAVELAACYFISVHIRIIDTYRLWPSTEFVASQGFFGFGKKKT